jgi:hypothetical protein
MDDNPSLVPKRLWMLWYQGIPSAPLIVKKCIDTWTQLNPTWDIIVLDSNNLREYVSLEMPERIKKHLSLAHQSDLVRLALLTNYGGVWADATTYCMRPLDDWIDTCSQSGFFAFYKPARDRIMDNWFMVSTPGCPLVAKLYERLTAFYTDNAFQMPTWLQIQAKNMLTRFLCRSHRTTRYWLSPLVTKMLGVYPYFIFNYLFERLVATDPECREIWDNTRKVDASGPCIHYRHGVYTPLNDAIRREFDDRTFPMYKLCWKRDLSRCTPSTWFFHLLHERGSEDLIDRRLRPNATIIH